jgi:ketosteroid isomerase-like protein
VELSVQTTSTDALVNLSPRKELTFTPLAIYASDANKLSGYTLDQLRQEFNPALDSLEFQQAVMALVHADATIMKTNVNHTITAKHEYRMANNDDIAISIKNSASTTTNNFSVDASGNVTIAGTLDAFTIKGDGSALDGLVKLDSDQTINGNKTFNNLITINHDLFVSNNIVSKDSGKLMMGTTTSLPGQDVIFHNKSICISTTSTPCTASQTSKGYIYAIGIETKGADYAEYFQAEETLTPGDIAGINPKTGRVRLLKAEDILLGVVSSKSGIRGNAWKSESDVLVGLIGQVPVKEEQVYEIKSKVYTKDGRLLGARLSNNDIYLNPSPYMAEEIKSLNNKLNTQQQEIENLKKQVQYLMQNLK